MSVVTQFSTRIKEESYKINMLSLLRSDIRKIKFPKIVVLQSFNRCNCSCNMCPYSYTVAKEPESRMKDETFEKLLNELASENEFETLIFAFQNEPLLEPRLISWAQKFKSRMPNKRLEMVTNGKLLTPPVAQEVLEYFDLIHVSLNALSPETHKKITNHDYFAEIHANLMAISNNKEWREKTVVRFIDQKDNHHEKQAFYTYWRNLGFKAFGFDVNDRLKDVKNFKTNIQVPGNFWKKVQAKINKKLGRLILPTCPIPFICIYVRADGNIVQCFNDWSRNFFLGNINDSTIKEVFNGKKYLSVRDKLLNDQLDENIICSKCDLYKDGIWLTV